MGVDCTAYERVDLVEARPVSSMSPDDWDALVDAGNLFLYNLDVFEARGDGFPEGIYRTSGESLRSSMNYGGYNRFRRALCWSVLAVEPEWVWDHYEVYEAQPFAPLIHFADNEGFLGPKTCARLAADAASVTVDLPEEWSATWPTWKAMFTLAADTGVIRYS